MKYYLAVKNPCRCFLRDGGIEHQTFENKEEAKEAAEELRDHMQKSYCKKHQFILTEMAGNYTITIRERH